MDEYVGVDMQGSLSLPKLGVAGETPQELSPIGDSHTRTSTTSPIHPTAHVQLDNANYVLGADYDLFK